MTESMVERVARAIARHRNRVDRGWDVDDGWDIAEGRAAIVEAHAPIKAMIERIAQRLESPHAQYVYVASNYRKSDLIRDLYAIADQPAPKGGEAGGTG